LDFIFENETAYRRGSCCVLTPCRIATGGTTPYNLGGIVDSKTVHEYVPVEKDFGSVKCLGAAQTTIPFGGFSFEAFVLLGLFMRWVYILFKP
jgi:hypothetical protein